MRRAALSLLVLLLSLAAPLSARAWWNPDWNFRKKIVIDPAAAGVQAAPGLTRVPILLRLHVGNFRFVDMQDNGAALRVIAADDKTPLPFQIERYD